MILLLQIRNLAQLWHNNAKVRKHHKSCDDVSIWIVQGTLMCGVSIFGHIRFYFKKKLVLFLKQHWVKAKAGGLGRLTRCKSANGSKAEPIITKQPQNFIYTKIFNHEAGEMDATWRIQCVMSLKMALKICHF